MYLSVNSSVTTPAVSLEQHFPFAFFFFLAEFNVVFNPTGQFTNVLCATPYVLTYSADLNASISVFRGPARLASLIGAYIHWASLGVKSTALLA